MNNKDLQIFVIFHKYLMNDCYKSDKNFNHEYFTFFKCNEKYTARYDDKFGYRILYEKNLKIYNPQLQDEKKPYMAVSALYHIYKNKLYKDLKYIGFMEYDLVLRPDPKLIKKTNNTNYYDDYFKSNITICETIKNICNNNDRHIIILSGRHYFKEFYNEKTIINKCNLFNKILNEYNDFFNSNHKIEELYEVNPIIGDQQSFITDINTFETIMSFISYIIENKYVEINGLRPSFLLARYIGICLQLINIKKTLLSLEHLNKHEWVD